MPHRTRHPSFVATQIADSRSPKWVCLLSVCLLGACGPLVTTAPFAEGPNSVREGSLLGPFEGRVVDRDTGQPIEKATVWCGWRFDRGIGSPAPAAARSATTVTNADGHYYIPRLHSLPGGLSTRLAGFSLLVTRKGYVAYRHDRVFEGQRARVDFTQRENLVRLSRWSPDLSRAEHLLFVGVDDLIRASGAEELTRAAHELNQPAEPPSPMAARTTAPIGAGHVTPAAPSPLPPRQAGLLLTTDDVRRVTHFTGSFQQQPLRRPEDTTDTLHFRATDQPERYDVAIRLWRLSGTRLSRKYDELLESLPGSKQTDDVADRSFEAVQGEIRGLAFLDDSHSALVLLTCGQGQCPTHKQVMDLARIVEHNLRKLPAAANEP